MGKKANSCHSWSFYTSRYGPELWGFPKPKTSSVNIQKWKIQIPSPLFSEFDNFLIFLWKDALEHSLFPQHDFSPAFPHPDALLPPRHGEAPSPGECDEEGTKFKQHTCGLTHCKRQEFLTKRKARLVWSAMAVVGEMVRTSQREAWTEIFPQRQMMVVVVVKVRKMTMVMGASQEVVDVTQLRDEKVMMWELLDDWNRSKRFFLHIL